VQDIRIKGKLETSLEVACARCLEPVVHDVERSFDLLYRPLGIDSGHAELSVTDAEQKLVITKARPGAGRYVARAGSSGAAVEDYCREDCKGLCPTAARI